jgi:lipopolysaccharide transport system ATP-binding protein
VLHFSGAVPGLSCVFTVYNHLGQHVAIFDSDVRGSEDRRDPDTGSKFVCIVDEVPLLPGHYRINVAMRAHGEMQDHIEGAAVFDVEEGIWHGRRMTRTTVTHVSIRHRWIVPG